MEIPELYNSAFFTAGGLIVLHSLWQALVALCVLKVGLLFINKKHSNLRYAFSIAAMALLVSASFITAANQFSISANSSVDNSVRVGASLSSTNDVLNETQTEGFLLNFQQSSVVSDLISTWSPYIAIIWFAGFIFFIVRLVQASLQLRGLRRLADEGDWLYGSMLQELTIKMGITRRISLIITQKVFEPITFGFLRPVILLPLSYTMGVQMEEAQMILAHELSHIKRRDYLVNVIQSMLDAVYFFNPFFRSLSNIMRTEREYCCDDMAITVCGDAETMALALTNLKHLTVHPMLSLSASPVKSSFHERIYRLILPGFNPRVSSGIAWLSSIILIAGSLTLLVQCSEIASSAALPGSTERMAQLYTDNQAGHKIEIFSYSKNNNTHDLFFVSEENGEPLYAYLDGVVLSTTDFQKTQQTLRNMKTMSLEEFNNLKPSDRARTLNQELDSIHSILAKPGAKPSIKASLLSASKLRTDEIKTLAMQEYRDDTRNLATDVKISPLLKDIVSSGTFTTDQRTMLLNLLAARR